MSISLSDLIGENAARLPISSTSSFKSRGLTVRSFRYDPPNPDMSKPPIIAIHGGPGFPHNYLLPLKLIALTAGARQWSHATLNDTDFYFPGYSVIFYDQAGCGQSEFVADPEGTAPWLLTLEYYVEEFGALVESLSLTNYYILGSSWGSILAQVSLAIFARILLSRFINELHSFKRK